MRLIREFFHLCFACIPGCGQMSQGYMKRGISQTIIVCGMLFSAVLLEMGVLSILIAPLWLYSFFDSFNLRRQIQEGAPPEDAYLFGLSEMDAYRFSQIFNKRHSLIGWVLVAVGLYNFYRIIASRILRALLDLFPWLNWLYGLLVWDMPQVLATILIFALGLWFIRGPRALQDQDAPAFSPPPEPPEAPPEKTPSPWTEDEAKFHEQPDPRAPDPAALLGQPDFPAEEREEVERDDSGKP